MLIETERRAVLCNMYICSTTRLPAETHAVYVYCSTTRPPAETRASLYCTTTRLPAEDFAVPVVQHGCQPRLRQFTISRVCNGILTPSSQRLPIFEYSSVRKKFVR